MNDLFHQNINCIILLSQQPDDDMPKMMAQWLRLCTPDRKVVKAKPLNRILTHSTHLLM